MSVTTTERAARDGFIDLPSEVAEALIKIGGALPAWSMEGTFLADATIERYRAELASVPQFAVAVESLLAMLSASGTGYAVVRLGNIVQALGAGDQFLRLATAILAEVAIPFQPFQRWPLWKEIGTNLNANPGLSTGTGVPRPGQRTGAPRIRPVHRQDAHRIGIR